MAQKWKVEKTSHLVEAIRDIKDVTRSISRCPPERGNGPAAESYLEDNGALILQADEDFSHGDLGEFEGSVGRRVREKGTEALAYYVSFHDFERFDSNEWGVYILESGLSYLAALLQRSYFRAGSSLFPVEGASVLRKDKLPWWEAVEHARTILLHHEIFHYEADCVAAGWESLLKKPCWSLHHDRVQAVPPGYDTVEEALANAHMYRSFRRASCRGSTQWLKDLIANSPEGYRDAFDYTGDREFEAGLSELCRRYAALPMAESGLAIGGCTLNASRLYELDLQTALLQCPVRIVLDAESRGLRPLGLSFISSLPLIEETGRFKRRLSKCPGKIQEEWNGYKTSLHVAVPRPPKFKKFRKCYSLALDAVNGGYRAHLVPVGGFQKWQAIDIGDHLEMGHGK